MELGLVAFVSRVIVAMGLGALIGLERELNHKPAGIRTHMLVTGSSALLLLINEKVVSEFADIATGGISSDPTRIIQAIVVGISFIGAGTILKSADHETVQNLTTSASILFAAGIGIVTGVGWFSLAITLSLILLATLIVVGWIERKVLKTHSKRQQDFE